MSAILGLLLKKEFLIGLAVLVVVGIAHWQYSGHYEAKGRANGEAQAKAAKEDKKKAEDARDTAIGNVSKLTAEIGIQSAAVRKLGDDAKAAADRQHAQSVAAQALHLKVVSALKSQVTTFTGSAQAACDAVMLDLKGRP
jgi:hypothetical protein